MKIAIVTDDWLPHISGVVTVLSELKKELEKEGHTILMVSPTDFRTVALPGYSEIRLALFPGKKLARILDAFKPDAIHVPVQAPLGFAAMRYCVKRKLPFTSAYHTRFPEYGHLYARIPLSWSYAYLRWFHSASQKTIVFSDALRQELEARGFKNLAVVPVGIDTELFSPRNPAQLPYPKPIFTYMGRITPEKNLEAFLNVDLPGTKYLIGDGPARAELEKKYPNAIFAGYKFGVELASELAASDVFVFPSLTDTLGLTMLEANACGVPVAALPSDASRSVITQGINGIISENLKTACLEALTLSRTAARDSALAYSWPKSAKAFLENIF